MLETALCLVGRTTLHGKYDVARGLLTDNFDDPGPVDDAIATGAAHRRAGYLAPLRFCVLYGNVFCVQMYQPFSHPFQPLVHILPGQVGIAGIQVDSDGRRFDQIVDTVQTIGRFGVLGVRFQPDDNAATLGDKGRFLKRSGAR